MCIQLIKIINMGKTMNRKVYLSLIIAAILNMDCFAGKQDILFEDDFYDEQKSQSNLKCVAGKISLKDCCLSLKEGKLPASKVILKKIQLQSNFEISYKFKILSVKRGHAGIRIAENNKKFIYIHFTSSGKFLGIQGCGKTIYKGINIDPEIWHDVKIICCNKNLKVLVDGKKIFDISDVSYNGGVSFFAYKTEMAFDNLVISKVLPGEKADAVNLIKNSSFEYSLAPNIPDYWGIGAWGFVHNEWIGKLDELWKLWRRDTVNPWHGKYCMRVDGLKGPYRKLASTFFNIKKGKIYTFSAYLRSNKDKSKIKVSFANWRGPKWTKDFIVNKKWQRISWTLPPAVTNQAGVIFNPSDDIVLWVDAVQVVQGEKKYTYSVDQENSTDSQKNVPVLKPAYTSSVPTFDGSLKDLVWKNAAKIKMLTINGGSPSEKTEAYLLYDNDNIYIGCRCFDSKIKQVRDKIHNRDGHVWNDDSIELFIGPSGPRGDWNDYYHLGVSITGAIYDAQKVNPGWNREWYAKTKRFSDRWEVEIILPFKMFDLNVFNQGDWIFNVCRENAKIKEFSCWSPTFGSFHKADNFGVLKAFPKKVTSKWLKKTTKQEKIIDDFKTTPLLYKGKPFVGYGLCWASLEGQPGDNAFKEMNKAGMNLLQYRVVYNYLDDETIIKVLKSAEKYNIKVAFWIDHLTRKGTQPPYSERLPKIKEIINKYKKYKSILCWMVVDEPHSEGENVIKCYQLSKKEDPSRPAYINLTPHGLGMRIAGVAGDIVSLDRYPFFFDGTVLSDFGPMLKLARKELITKPRPLWMFIQGFGYALWVKRAPTPEEFSAQVYMCLVNGVTGIISFNAIILPSNTWEKARQIGEEIKKLTPVLLCNNYVRVTCGNKKINFMARKHAGKVYIFAVNPYSKPLKTKFLLQGNIISAKRIFSNNPVKTKDNQIDAAFKAFERQCFEIDIKGN